MYQNEQFSQVGTVPAGELVIKIPGSDLKMPFSEGKAYVNARGNMGYVALNVTDVVVEPTGEEAGLFAVVGGAIAEQLQDPNVRASLQAVLASSKTPLAYSRGVDGREFITIPGASGESGIEDGLFENAVVGVYSTSDGPVSAEQVYALHCQAVGDAKLVEDKKEITKATLSLVDRANKIYEEGLALMKRQTGFF